MLEMVAAVLASGLVLSGSPIAAQSARTATIMLTIEGMT